MKEASFQIDSSTALYTHMHVFTYFTFLVVEGCTKECDFKKS